MFSAEEEINLEDYILQENNQLIVDLLEEQNLHQKAHQSTQWTNCSSGSSSSSSSSSASSSSDDNSAKEDFSNFLDFTSLG